MELGDPTWRDLRGSGLACRGVQRSHLCDIGLRHARGLRDVVSGLQQTPVAAEVLDEVAAVQEGVHDVAEVLSVLAQAGEGSVRDSLSALDQAIACCGAKLNAGEVRELLGMFSLESLDQVAQARSERGQQVEIGRADSHRSKDGQPPASGNDDAGIFRRRLPFSAEGAAG